MNGASIFFEWNTFLCDNCSFINNSAIYGDENASYPLKMKLSDSNQKYLNSDFELLNISSGSLLPFDIEIEICDIYNQKISTLNNGFVSVKLEADSSDDYVFLGGTRTVNIVNGLAIYNDLIMFSRPINLKLKLIFENSLINENLQKINVLENQNSNELINNSQYSFFFWVKLRPCEVGEIYDEKLGFCSKCPSGSYSLNINDTKCNECPLFADCFGGANFSLHVGYWRSDIYSNLFHVCEPFADSCL